jgi:glycosyltransferase involved in cell wall biosynthesis
MAEVSVVIPTLNEAEAIGLVIRELPGALVHEVIVADGGSTDGTQAVAAAAGARVIDAGRGYGRACRAGIDAASPASRVIVFIDGDGADRGDLVGQIVEPVLARTHDLVLATRTRGGCEPGAMLWHQMLAGRLAGFGIGLAYRARYSDMCAFRAIDRTALERLSLHEMGYGWNLEMQIQAARARLRILEVPLPYRRRAGGASKVAGSLNGTLRASWNIATACLRIAASPAPEA